MAMKYYLNKFNSKLISASMFLPCNQQFCVTLIILYYFITFILEDAGKQGFNLMSTSYCRGQFEWVKSSNGSVPRGAVRAGTDYGGAPLYAGRITFDGDVIPAKISTKIKYAYFSSNGYEYRYRDYEALVSNDTAWKRSSGGAVPPEALTIGTKSDGEPVYMGRTLMEGTLTPGKVDPQNRCLFVPYNGSERKFYTYEVLILLK